MSRLPRDVSTCELQFGASPLLECPLSTVRLVPFPLVISHFGVGKLRVQLERIGKEREMSPKVPLREMEGMKKEGR